MLMNFENSCPGDLFCGPCNLLLLPQSLTPSENPKVWYFGGAGQIVPLVTYFRCNKDSILYTFSLLKMTPEYQHQSIIIDFSACLDLENIRIKLSPDKK